jgi:hypothetical protein
MPTIGKPFAGCFGSGISSRGNLEVGFGLCLVFKAVGSCLPACLPACLPSFVFFLSHHFSFFVTSSLQRPLLVSFQINGSKKFVVTSADDTNYLTKRQFLLQKTKIIFYTLYNIKKGFCKI